MVSPIIVIGSGRDVLVFSSIAAAEGYLEPIDVQNGEYVEAYDAEGRLLRLLVTTKKMHFLWFFPTEIEVVAIQPAETEPTHQEEVTQGLRAFLSRLRNPPERLSQAALQEMTLREMVEQALKFKIY